MSLFFFLFLDTKTEQQLKTEYHIGSKLKINYNFWQILWFLKLQKRYKCYTNNLNYQSKKRDITVIYNLLFSAPKKNKKKKKLMIIKSVAFQTTRHMAIRGILNSSLGLFCSTSRSVVFNVPSKNGIGV